MLAAIEHKPIDRIAFWPKLDAAYQSWYGKQLGTNNIEEIHKLLGTDQHYTTGGGYDIIHKNNTSQESNNTETEHNIIYRIGNYILTEKHIWDGPSCSWHPVKHPINTPEDVKAMTEFIENMDINPNKESIKNCYDQINACPDALWAYGIGQSSLMHFVEWMAGIETAHFLLADVPDEVEDLFNAYHKYLLKITKFAIENINTDLYYYVENTSTTLISPDQYNKYCFENITQYGNILVSAGKRMALHMCGHLRKLLPKLSQLPAAVFEAFTSPPVGNTTLAEGRKQLPNQCLIGGTSAVTWLKKPDEIIEEINGIITETKNLRGIILTSGGVMPPLCKPETIRTVAQWLQNIPVN